MGTPLLFKFLIQDSTNKYYYVDNNGEVQLSVSEKSLQNSPRNWDKIKRKYGRNPQSWGLFRNTSIPPEFNEDGAKILRHIYYKDGLLNYNTYAKFTILKRNDTGTNVWSYSTWFSTEIDFANEPNDGVDERGNFFAVNMSDRGVPELITDASNKDITIPFDTGYTTIKMTGFPLRGTYRWLTGDLGTATTIVSGGVGGLSTYYAFPMGLAEDSSNYFKRLFLAQQQGVSNDVLNNVPLETNRFLSISIDQSFTCTISISAEIDVVNTGGAANMQLSLDIMSYDMAGVTNNFTNLFTSATIVSSSTVNISVTSSFTFIPQKNYYITLRCPATTTQNVDVTVVGYNMSVVFNKSLPETSILAFKYKTLVEKAFNIATNGAVSVASNFLNLAPTDQSLSFYYNSSPNEEYITCGDAIRGITTTGIKLRIADILKDLYARWMVGYSSFDGNARIERLDYFLQNVLIGELPEVANFSKTTATDLLFNSITCGYDEAPTDKLNGKFDFASKQSYSSNVTRISVDDDLVSPFNVSPFEIERLRSDLDGEGTTSDTSDNRVFILQASLQSGEIKPVKYTGSVNGFLSDEIYNIGLTPHRFPLRHIPRYRAILNAKAGVDAIPKLFFEQGERYTAFSTFINSFYIPENGDILPAAQTNGYVPDKLFIPTFFRFDAYPTIDLMTAIENNPFGYIRFYDQITENWYNGYIWDVEVSPNDIDKYTLVLLAANNTDLKNLIY